MIVVVDAPNQMERSEYFGFEAQLDKLQQMNGWICEMIMIKARSKVEVARLRLGISRRVPLFHDHHNQSASFPVSFWCRSNSSQTVSMVSNIPVLYPNYVRFIYRAVHI